MCLYNFQITRRYKELICTEPSSMKTISGLSQQGVEIHILRSHNIVTHVCTERYVALLEFLPGYSICNFVKTCGTLARRVLL